MYYVEGPIKLFPPPTLKNRNIVKHTFTEHKTLDIDMMYEKATTSDHILASTVGKKKIKKEEEKNHMMCPG